MVLACIPKQKVHILGIGRELEFILPIGMGLSQAEACKL